MTFYARNGSGDAWFYGRWEDEDVYERFIALSGFNSRSRYGSYGGWIEAEDAALIDENTTLITTAMLDTIEASGNVKNELDKLEEMESGAFFDDFDEVLDD